jgi:DNA processing protein
VDLEFRLYQLLMNGMQGPDRPSDRALLVALNSCPGLPRAALCRLAQEIDTWRDCMQPGRERALASRFSISLDYARAAIQGVAGAKATLLAEEQAAERLGARLVTRLETDYPTRLADLALPPPVLAIAGSGAALFEHPGARATLPAAEAALSGPTSSFPAVAIVGSRKASPYGLEVASWLARELARQGVVVVSGFARGIDAAAHQGALAAEHGLTIGVLGCGLSCDYPKGHRELGQRIRGRGALISEFPCALGPTAGNFPIRNRIIAALAGITVVVEAAAHSGSLITARLALELGREVLAVPGRITDEQALGTNDLLRDGAAPVTHPADILERLGLPTGEARGASPEGTVLAPPSLPPAQSALLQALDPTRDLAIDQLAANADLGIDVAVGALLELELAGWAIRSAVGGYRRGSP